MDIQANSCLVGEINRLKSMCFWSVGGCVDSHKFHLTSKFILSQMTIMFQITTLQHLKFFENTTKSTNNALYPVHIQVPE